MAQVIFKQAEIDQELVQLVQHSPSLNAMSKLDREKVILRVFTFPVNKQLEIKDMLLREQEDMAKATPEDMHARYMKLKELYADLKGEKTQLEGKLRKVKESNAKKEEAGQIAELEKELEEDEEPPTPNFP